MRIAITGSSGLIGTALQHSLRADGHTPVPVIRRTGEAGTISWDPEAGRLEPNDLEGLDGVVHLAGEGIGEKRWTPEQKGRIVDSRTKGTLLLASALASLDRKPPVFVSGSAIGFYGNRGDEQLDETSAPGSGFLAELCLAWEAATAAAEAAGIRVAKIRTGIVLDGKGGALPRMALPFKLGIGGRIGSGKQWMSWITLADHISAVRFLLDNAVAGPVNLTAPAPVTNAVLAKALGRVLHRPAVVPVPKLGPQLLLGKELAEELLFFSQRVQPNVLLDAGFTFAQNEIEHGLKAALDRD